MIGRYTLVGHFREALGVGTVLLAKRSATTFAVRNVAHADLPDGVLAIWVRAFGHDRVTVSAQVPDGAVAAVLRHLREHGNNDVAEALGLLTCKTEDCQFAQTWRTRLLPRHRRRKSAV